MRNRTAIDSLLVYSAYQNPFPGEILAGLSVSKRWPNWEVARSSSLSKGIYDVFYVGYTSTNQTRLSRTAINVATRDVSTYNSRELIKSGVCKPNEHSWIEVTEFFVVMTCLTDIIVYERSTLEMVVRIPNVRSDNRTLTFEKTAQLNIIYKTGSSLNLIEILALPEDLQTKFRVKYVMGDPV